jgi:ATP-dependent Zn protease
MTIAPDRPSPRPPLRRAKDLVQSNIDILHKVAAVLIDKENIDGAP